MKKTLKLPTFFVVGTQKAGTTTLYKWLTKQQDICLPVIKETHFFRDKEKYDKGIEWYKSWFRGSSENDIMGEIDPEYMFFKETATRIRKYIVNPKFLFILRNPIERAYSHYCMSVRRGYESLPFNDALLEERKRLNKNENKFSMIHHSYLSRGRYCSQINHYHEIFPKSEFLYIKFDDMFGNRTCENTYKQICEFIGLKSKPILPDISKRNNPASEPRSILLRDLVYKNYQLKKVIGNLIPSETLKLKLAMMIDRANQKPSQNRLNDWRLIVNDQFWRNSDKEIKNLEILTGLKLQDWLSNRISYQSPFS